METFKRVCLAALILAAGIATAWYYRLEPLSGDEAARREAAYAADPARPPVGAQPPGPLQGVPLPLPFDSRAAMPPPPVVVAPGRVEPPQMAELYEAARRPPPLPPILSPLEDADPPQPPPVPATGQDALPDRSPTTLPAQLTPPPAAAAPNAGTSAEPETTKPYRVHTIVNGDTLTRLARRYLGNPARAPEIFALNQEVLSDPEILPIGQQIRLPHREVSSDNEGLATESWPPAATDRPPRLVPLPPQASSQP